MLTDKLLGVFRDEEAVVLDLIEGYFAKLNRVVYTGDQTPADTSLDQVLPFIRVGRTGGAPIRGSEHTDRPVIDIDVLADTRREAKEIGKLIEQLLLSAPHPIDDCNVLMSSQRVPWVENSSRIQRMYSSYQLSFRR